MQILYRYIQREIFTPLAICLVTFCGILFLARSLKLIQLIVNKNVPVWDIVVIFSLLLPRFIEIALPMSLMLGIIIGLGRLSADSELIVIRGIGINLKKLSIPIIQIAILCTLITASLTFWIRPWSSNHLGQALFELAKSQASSTITPGVFNTLGALTIYAEKVEDNGAKLTNVVIGDSTNLEEKRTFIAKYGEIIANKKKRSLIMKLYDGSIPEGHGENFTITKFQTNQINIPLYNLIESDRDNKKSSEMLISELIKSIRKNEKSNPHLNVELHQRLAIPFSCILLSVAAMMLGIQPSRTSNNWGGTICISLGISLILIYYLLFAILSALSDNNTIPTIIGVWAPNILLGVLSYYLFMKLYTEQWISVADAISSIFERKKA